MLKSYLKSYIYLFSILTILTLIYSIINYFINIPSLIKMLIPIISTIVASFVLGKRIKEKAYLEGLKFISIYLIFIIILGIILKNPFTIKKIIYYIILLSSSMIGSMIGINSKRNKV